MTPGDRPDLPLAEEPHLGLRPPLTGSGALGGVQPVKGPFSLEEEPALWPRHAGASAAARPGREPVRRALPGAGRTTSLPATGLGAVPAAGGFLLLAAVGLRLRRLR